MTSPLEPQVSTARRMYHARAVTYEDSWHPSFAQWVVDFLSPAPGSHILDLACGTGLVTFAAAKAVGPTGSVTGVDVTEGMLDVANQKLESLKRSGNEILPTIKLLNHDITKLDSLEEIKGKQFDAITCASALVLLDNQFEALVSWSKYLKPGGYLVVDVPHPRNIVAGIALEKVFVRLGIQPPYLRVQFGDEKSYRSFIAAVGFQTEDVVFKEQAGFHKRLLRVEDGEEVWDKQVQSEPAKPLIGKGVVEKAKKMFLEEWKHLADKDGNIEEVDGVYVVKAQKTEDPCPKPPIMSGSCACGTVRWKSGMPPDVVTHCCCVPCRKVSGGPFCTFMDIPACAVSFTPRLSELKSVTLTPHARRTFCGTCGSTLTFQHFARLDWIEVAMGTIDEESLAQGALDGAKNDWGYLRSKASWWNIPEDGWARHDTMTSESALLIYADD